MIHSWTRVNPWFITHTHKHTSPAAQRRWRHHWDFDLDFCNGAVRGMTSYVCVKHGLISRSELAQPWRHKSRKWCQGKKNDLMKNISPGENGATWKWDGLEGLTLSRQLPVREGFREKLISLHANMCSMTGCLLVLCHYWFVSKMATLMWYLEIVLCFSHYITQITKYWSLIGS